MSGTTINAGWWVQWTLPTTRSGRRASRIRRHFVEKKIADRRISSELDIIAGVLMTAIRVFNDPVFSVLWGRLLKQLEDNMVGQPDLDFTERRHALKEVPNRGGG